MGKEMSGYPWGSEFLTFTEHEIEGRKTPIYEIHGKRSGTLLGMIKWYGPWRQFCFYPEPQTLFNRGCLEDILVVTTFLNAQRRSDKA
jgi:hypothetical protein